MTTDVLIRVNGLHMDFGTVKALNGVDLEIRKGDVTVIISKQ